MRKRRHPVWDVYDEFRTACYIAKAYSKRIHEQRRLRLWMDIVLAVFTPSSAVASFFFWDTQWGKVAWNTFIVTASVVAISKPLFRFDDHIKNLLQSLSGYTHLLNDLEDLKTEIAQRGSFDNELRARFAEIRRMKMALASDTALLKLSNREKERLFGEVNKQWPVSRFYVPDDEERVNDGRTEKALS